MAWFLNFYRCERCRKIWTDEWSCMCDDECPRCGTRNMSPFDNANLTELVVQEKDQFVALRSSKSAERKPDYEELGLFPTREKAEEFLASIEDS